MSEATDGEPGAYFDGVALWDSCSDGGEWDDWPGLGPVILAAVKRAEELGL